MKKYGFTMVELIFVIVILGILAAVAVPKLNASRDDAEITKFAANLATLRKDVQNYYLANGTIMTSDTAAGSNYDANPIKITSVLVPIPPNTIESALQIGGKDCLNVFLTRRSDGTQWLALRRYASKENANALCKKVFEVFAQRPELKALLDGRASYSLSAAATNLADKTPASTATVYVLLNESSVEFD